MSGHRKWADVKAQQQAKVDHMELQVMRGLLDSLDYASRHREPTWDLLLTIAGEARRLVADADAALARAAELRAETMLEASSFGSPQAKAITASGVIDLPEDEGDTVLKGRPLPRSVGAGHGPGDLSQREGFSPEEMNAAQARMEADRRAFPAEWEGEGE